MKRLKGKTALITGGNSGVGEATAMLFAREGADVVITARRGEQLKIVAEKIKAGGGSVLAIRGDVSKPYDSEMRVSRTLETFGKLDILVNNAGVRDEGLRPVDKVTDSEIDRVVGINTKGVMYCTRAVLKDMLKNKKGVIINVASSAGLSGGGGAAYVASKAAILGITKHTAIRCAKSGVRCNALCPSMIKTPMADTTGEIMDSDMMESVMAHSDLTLPVCSAQDVANSILFFASDEAAPITGQCVALDYGSNL